MALGGLIAMKVAIWRDPHECLATALEVVLHLPLMAWVALAARLGSRHPATRWAWQRTQVLGRRLAPVHLVSQYLKPGAIGP
jgi:hypothetical protein